MIFVTGFDFVIQIFGCDLAFTLNEFLYQGFVGFNGIFGDGVDLGIEMKSDELFYDWLSHIEVEVA
jgi:hypothetical protein